MPIIVRSHPMLMEISIAGEKERYKFFNADNQLFQIINGRYVGPELPQKEIDRLRYTVESFKKEMPKILAEAVEDLKLFGESKGPSDIWYSGDEHRLVAHDDDADGRADSVFITNNDTGQVINIEANQTAYCAREAARSDPARCDRGDRTIFKDDNVLANRSSDTAGSPTICVERQLNPVIFGCYGEGRVDAYKIDRSRRGVREYLKLFDELFEK